MSKKYHHENGTGELKGGVDVRGKARGRRGSMKGLLTSAVSIVLLAGSIIEGRGGGTGSSK